MQYVGHSKPKLLIASEGKQLGDINDVYRPAKYDENGLIEPEHFPYYSSVIFLGDQITSLEECKKIYIEEDM